MSKTDFKHKLHEQALSHHFDMDSDLFFCLARVYQDFKKIYPIGDALHYYDASFHLQKQVNDIFQPEITLSYDITQQKKVNELQLERLRYEEFSHTHIEKIDDLNQFNVTASFFKYIKQAKSLFVQWNESYYPLQFNKFRLTMFEKASLKYASTVIALTQPEASLLEPHYKQEDEEQPLTAYVSFSLSKPPFIFQYFSKNKGEDKLHRIRLQPKGRVKRQNEKLRQQTRLESEQ